MNLEKINLCGFENLISDKLGTFKSCERAQKVSDKKAQSVNSEDDYANFEDEPKKSNTTQKPQTVTNEKINKALKDIENGLNEIKEKKQELREKGYELGAKLINNQFSRQVVYVNALSELSTEELEDFIEQYGKEEFAREILETLAWQPANGLDIEAYNKLRDKIENEIDDNLRKELYDNSHSFERVVKFGKYTGERISYL